MKTTLQGTFGLFIGMCLGLTLACVKVDVSIAPSGTHHLTTPSPLPDEKPTISIAKLGAIHTTIKSVCRPSFSRDIDEEKQQTLAWCWAASTRMVMKYHNEERQKPTNLQCNIVNKIWGGLLNGSNCCQIRGTFDFIDTPTNDFIDVPLNCVRGGWPYWVFDAYRFNYEAVDSALTWETLTGEICSKGPFISVIEWKEGGRHAFVVEGYNKTTPNLASNPSLSQQYVRIYDPIPTTTEDNSSEGDHSIIPYEEYVGDSSPNAPGHYGYFHYREYVQISPKTMDQQ